MNSPRCWVGLLCCLSAVQGGGVSARAEEPKDEPKLEVVAEGLVNPWGLAVQPRSGRVFVANSGAGEILAVEPKGQPQPVVTGFATELGGPDNAFRLGPVGLAFTSANLLLVSTLAPEATNPVRAYAMPKELRTVAWDSNAPAVATTSGGRRVWRIAPSGSGAFAAVAEPGAGWIERWPLGKQAKAERLVEPGPLGGGAGTWTLTTSPQGELLVGLAGSVGEARDSRLVFCGARSGKALLSSALELRDLIDLAYSPKTGRLFAADFSASLPGEGGIFRLDAAGTEVQPVRIVTLERPTALAFGEDGALFAAQLLGPADPAGKAPGRVVRILGGW